jgi:hypothetical protein
MIYTHIVNGNAAAQTLRRALDLSSRSDGIVALPDDLTVGPVRTVDDASALRAAFWQRVLADQSHDVRNELDSALAQLRRLSGEPGEIVMWHAQSAGDQLALRRLAYHLRNAPQKLSEVGMTAAEIAPDVEQCPNAWALQHYSEEALARRLKTIAPVSILRIGRLALEWQELKHINSETRRLRDNTFEAGNFAELDALILEHSTREWRPLPELARAIAHAHPGFPVTDPLALWRCRELTVAGRLLLAGNAAAGAGMMVRLATPS